MDTAGQRAIHAIRAILRDHKRAIANTGTGWSCTCGEHFPNPEAFDHHRAELATDAAARILTPDP